MKTTITLLVLTVLLAATVDGRAKRATTEEKAKMSKVMKLVEIAKLQDCVGRVICALNCDPDGFGQDGKRVFQMMLAIQTSGSLNETETRYYLNAGMNGRRLRQDNTCGECDNMFANCQATTQDLVDVTSLVQLNSSAE